MRSPRRVLIAAAVVLAFTACLRPAEERALSDLEIGIGAAGSVSIQTPSAHITSTSGARIALWANHPVIDLELSTPQPTSVIVDIDNCMPAAEAVSTTAAVSARAPDGRRLASCVFDVELPSGTSAIRIAPPDHDVAAPFRFAVMGDIQTGLDRVSDVFDTIAAQPGIRFVISTGDLVEENREDEYRDLLAELAHLPVPYFSTIGNHELAQAEERWSEIFGRHNLHFDFKDVAFSLVDTGSATIDPMVYDWLDDWLDDASDRIHVYGQHYPAIDPVGVRQAGMRSRKEAALLLSKLAAGNVDTTFYGHIHSFYAFENAGMPAYISGGGGALPERLDGIGRHVLVVDVDPGRGEIVSVSIVRVD